jgi:L-aminopeptidase/D-esterase-like protein
MIHAILLSGGSAFGLDAAGGVMEYLEERNIGFDVGITKVPLVCQSCLFDLGVGSFKIRPDKKMGYVACANAEKGNYTDGNFGAGTGATVGKLHGAEGCMKSGIGSYAVQIGELKVGAVVAVNALGDVYDWKNGEIVAGLLDKNKKTFLNTENEVYKSYDVIENKFVENTTIGVIITNAKFNKTQLCKIASMTHNGYARAIRPVHTSADGDSIYAISVGEVAADQDMVGTLAAQVMSEAILRAAMSADSDYGFISAKEL